jgi:transcriptional regulator with XRE-family HTH domain
MRDRLPHIAVALRKARAAAGLSQRNLAAIADVSRPTIAALELGSHHNVQTETVRKLAQALGVSPNELMGLSRRGEEYGADAPVEGFLRSPAAELLKVTPREVQLLRALSHDWQGGQETVRTFFFLLEAIRSCDP